MNKCPFIFDQMGRPPRWTGALMAGVVLISMWGPVQAESAFWEERAAARARLSQAHADVPVMMAQLPSTVPVSWGAALPRPAALPDLHVEARSALWPAWVQRDLLLEADVRRVQEGSSGPQVYLVMDAHDISSAQRRIARLLARLSERGPVLVGVEGTSGAFHVDPYRDLLPASDQKALADHLLKKGFLNGPESAAITTAHPPLLWGVEDPALYDANVEAYRQSLPGVEEARTALRALKEETHRTRRDIFSPDLLAWDDAVQAAYEDQGTRSSYAQGLSTILGAEVGEQTRRFVKAMAVEKSLSFPEVERDRTRFIAVLSPRLSTAEGTLLVEKSVDLRAGTIPASRYYEPLEAMAKSKGLEMGDFPAFRDYIRYVSVVDSVDPSLLMEEWERLEVRAYSRLAHEKARALVEWILDLRLAERAVQHALTPREWEQFQKRRGALSLLGDRAESMGMSRTPADRLAKHLPSFAAFFEAADHRNRPLLENLLGEARRRGVSTAVLVTGGFHAPALEVLMAERNVPYAVLSPRMEADPGEAGDYLQAFAPIRTPLEQLLLGQRLTMNPPSATSVAVQHPGSPFHDMASALKRASLTYGVTMAGPRGDVGEFVSRWNLRFGESAPTRVQVKTQENVQVATVQFPGAHQSVLIATPKAGSGDPQIAESLSQVVQGQGARVVETDRLGEVSYALGGRSVSRVLPEVLAGGALLGWWGANALSPPGPVEWAGLSLLGGAVVRALVLGSAYWHGLGHALSIKAFGKSTLIKAMTGYTSSLPWRSLLPFASIFIPGISPAREAPRMENEGLAGWRQRVAALAGPTMNLMAFGLMAPMAMAAGPGGIFQATLAAAAGINLWTAFSSVSDVRTAVSGIGRAFACGVIGVVYGGPNPKAEPLPASVQALLDQATRRTLHRGGQSGGMVGVALRENGHAELSFFVEKTAKEKNRRSRLDQLMRDSMARLAARALAAGFSGMGRAVVVAHTRYGTNLAAPKQENAHPHLSAPGKDTAIYIGDAKRSDAYERPWLRPSGPPAVKLVERARGVAIAHNGDDNATILYRKGDTVLTFSNDDDARLSERMTGYRNPAEGDSPQIATRMDRWITQGSVAASLRLTLLTVGLETLSGGSVEEVLDRAPTPGRVAEILPTYMVEEFERDLRTLHARHPAAAHLEDLFREAGAQAGPGDQVWDLEAAVPFAPGSDLERMRNAMAQHAASLLRNGPEGRDLSGAELDQASVRFADLFLKFFFTGDLRRAGIHLLRRADPTSTFGVMGTSLTEPESAVWMRQLQPFYLWMSADGRSVAGSSESTAFLGGQSGDSPFRYRLTLGDGEVASLAGDRMAIDHVERGRVAEFNLSDPGFTAAQTRWLDVEASPAVPKPPSRESAPERRVRDDVEMIPWADLKIKESFADPLSHNSQSGRSLVEHLTERLMGRRGGRGGRGLDLVIVGTEKSYDAGTLHGKALEKISSLAGRRLNIRVVYGAEFRREDLVKLRDEGFGSDTVVLGLASSGQTANTFYVLKNLQMAWKGLVAHEQGAEAAESEVPPHYLVSSHMDNPYTEEVLKQGLRPEDPFKSRNFVTFPSLDPFHPAEAATVTHKSMERLLKEMTILFADRVAQRSRRWTGGGLGADVPAAVRAMIDNGDELNRRIVGLDADGNPHLRFRQTEETNDIPDQIKSVAKRLRQAFLESLWGTGATAVFISLTLLFHATPATFLLGWLPNPASLFSDGLPSLALLVGAFGAGAGVLKGKMWRWHPLFLILGVITVGSASLLAGEALVLGLDQLGSLAGVGALGSRWGALPLFIDVSPVNLANAVTYIFFFFSFTLGLRKLQGRPIWDRVGGRILVLSDAQHSVARLNAARWRRMLNHRFSWMGLHSVNESSLGRLTHEESLNSNVRGNIFIQGESRQDEGPTVMNFKQLGGSPNGPGRAWRLGIGHKPKASASSAYSEGYISLAMRGDLPAGQNPDWLELQELLQDAPARDTAGLMLALEVAEGMASVRPLHFVVGMTSSEAKTSTTQQPYPPLSDEQVREVFGFSPMPAPRLEERASTSALSKIDSIKPIEEPVIEAPRQPVPRLNRMALVSLAAALGVLAPSRARATMVAGEIVNALQARGAVDVRGEHEQALFQAIMVQKVNPPARIYVADGPDAPRRTLDELQGQRPSGLGWDSIRATWDGVSYTVSPTPPLPNNVSVLSPPRPSEPGPLPKPPVRVVAAPSPVHSPVWERVGTTVLQFTRRAGRAAVILVGSLLLTSWGGDVLSALERSVIHKRIVSPTAAVAQAVPIPTTELIEIAGKAALSLGYVNTRHTGLRTFEQHPFDGVRTVGRVGDKAHVAVLEREGGWARVRTTGGKTGWAHGRHFFFLENNQALVVGIGSALFETRPFSKAGARGLLPKGTSVNILDTRGAWVKVAPLGAKAATGVWVSARYVAKGAPGVTGTPQDHASPVELMPRVQADEKSSNLSLPLAVAMGPAFPLLGSLGRRTVPSPTSPGALLRARLMTGARRPWAEKDRPIVESLLEYVEKPQDLDWESQALRMSVGYGILIGEGTEDRAVLDDFRRTRALLKTAPLSAAEGRGLTRLVRWASRQERGGAPPDDRTGLLKVIDLSEAETQTHLVRHWAMALLHSSQVGGRPPILVARNTAQKVRLGALFREWIAAHPEIGVDLPAGSVGEWALVENLGPAVAERDSEGRVRVMRLGALLKTAQVDPIGVTSVDVVSDVRTGWMWDRSDLPSRILVRLVLSVLNNVSLSAPLEETQGAIRAIRKTLTAA